MGRAEWNVTLPELDLVSTLGNGTVASPWNGIKIVELVQDGLRIVLTIGGLLIRPVCENDSNSDAWWISSRTVVDKRLWGVSGGTHFGNYVPRNCENIVERRRYIGTAGRKPRPGCRD